VQFKKERQAPGGSRGVVSKKEQPGKAPSTSGGRIIEGRALRD